MQHEQMLNLIISSGLEVVLAFEHNLRYNIGLHVGTRFQCDVIAFKSRTEFEALTTEEAQELIDVSKTDMLRAAKTKSGKLKETEEEKQAREEKAKTTVKMVKKKESDVEKYLRQMRARGNKLAKTVRYG